jgi:hypothetical protein
MEDNMKDFKVLIACECSGTVRDAFSKAGYDAFSCDIKPDVNRSNRHIQDDIRNVLPQGWDMLVVAHPPCTRLCNSGVRWLHKAPPNRTLEEMWRELDEGAELFSELWNADIPHIAIENPVIHKYAKERIRGYEQFAQSIQPWQFGTDPDSWDATKKRTCLWLKNLPSLIPTGTLTADQATDKIHKMGPSPERSALRAKFFDGIANAMASQWGNHVSGLA